MTSKDYFKGKRLAVIGLGHDGVMVEDIKFLIKAGALVSVYDMKSEARVKNHLIFLRTVGLANYVCGSIPADDLLDMDMIILSYEYPRNSSFLKSAKEKGIPIEYPATLFFKQAPPVTVVGIMGESGKSTVFSMLSIMLQKACSSENEQGLFMIDPESNDGTLVHLKKVKNGDLVLLKITGPMMIEMTQIRISPQVAIFTTVPGKGSYDKSPFEILTYQTYNNFLIASDEVIDAARGHKELPRSKMLRTKSTLIPDDWQLKQNGTHDRENASLALQAARLFKLEDEEASRILSTWKPLKGRIELVKKLKNVEFYNDSASSNALSTRTAMEVLSKEKNVILIFGGANTICDYDRLFSILPSFVHTMILLPGSGTLRQRVNLEKVQIPLVISAPSIEEAVRLGMDHAKKGDKILFSPGFEVGGADGSRKERGERFVRAVRGL